MALNERNPIWEWAWQHAGHILCVRLDTLGDVLMTTPAIRALKESGPRRRITLLTSPPGAAVAQLVPEIDEVLVHEAPWMKASAPQASSQGEHALIARLQAARFDAAVIFTVYSQNPLPAATLCYLADIPLRLAYCHENPYQLLTQWVPDPEPSQYIRHEVQRQLDLVAVAGCQPASHRLSLRVPEQAQARIAERLAALGLPPAQPWVLVHPGATAASRRYPPENFAAVVRQLVLQYGLQVLFTGAGPEVELIDRIREASGVNALSVAGQLDLGELAALVARAPLLLANNSGPVHMAAALGTPVVDLYALTNPQHTPWAVPNRVLYAEVPCAFCYKSVCPQGHHNCLRLVTPGAVIAAVLDLLHDAGGWSYVAGGWRRARAASPAGARDALPGRALALPLVAQAAVPPAPLPVAGEMRPAR